MKNKPSNNQNIDIVTSVLHVYQLLKYTVNFES